MGKVKKQTKKASMTANVKATFLFAVLVAAFIISMSMINFTGVTYAADSTTLPANFTATATDKTSVYTSYITGVGFTRDITATVNGKVYQLYCLEYSKAFPSTGTAYTKNTTNNDNYVDDGIIYILTHGYDQNSAFLGTGYSADEKKYITQMAIWYYQCIRDGQTTTDGSGDYLSADWISRINANTRYGKEIVKLAQAAKTAKDNPITNSISIDGSSVTYSLTSDLKYMDTSYITPTYTGTLKSYSISIPNNTYGAKLIGEDGKEIASGTSLAPGKKFKVRVETAKVRNTNSITIDNVTITGKFEKQVAYSYLPASSDYQTILYAAYESADANAVANLRFMIRTGPVKISKQDITNGEEVPGATLVIKDCNGVEVASWVSTTEPHFIEALPYYSEQCKYTLTETIAPEGYEKSTTTVEFNVKPSGEVTSVVMTNTPETPVPDTATTIPWYVYIIGGLAIATGIVVVVTNTNERKQKV